MGAHLSAAEALIVLGGGVTPNGLPTPATQRRLDTALELFAQVDIPHLIFSGRWSHNLRNKPARSEAEAMREQALARGIGHGVIRLEDRSHSTLENIYNCKRDFLAPGDLRNILFVTDPAYQDRTREIGKRVLGADFNFDIVTTSAPSDSDAKEIQGLFDFNNRIESAHLRPGDDDKIAALITLEATLARMRLSA